MKRSLALEYNIGDLTIAPYLEGLRSGRAIARQCGSCSRTTFPPERHCICEAKSGHQAEPRWTQLSGRARLILRTDGPLGSFALAHFEGADNRAVCRVENGENNEAVGILVADQREIPGIVIMIVGDVIESAG